MALDFGLSHTADNLKTYEHVGFFNPNEASYWFLWPLWKKLKTQTDRLVDLYDVTCFKGHNLDFLEGALQEARVLVEAQPEKWEVVVGWEGYTRGKEIKCPLSKSEMNELLDAIEKTVKRAKEEKLYIVFYGD